MSDFIKPKYYQNKITKTTYELLSTIQSLLLKTELCNYRQIRIVCELKLMTDKSGVNVQVDT